MSFVHFSFSQDMKKIEYLKAFSKVYGYVKYFHPSDEAFELDWNTFAIYGASEVEKCNTKQEFIETLNKLFNPIAPSVNFSKAKKIMKYNYKTIRPKDLKDYHLTYWHHRGVSFGMKPFDDTYKSIRVNRSDSSDSDRIFNYQPNFGTLITREIDDGIYCQVPIVLFCNENSTYPKADAFLLSNLKEQLEKCQIKAENLTFRLGNIINVYNVFQHFYPYFDVVRIDWDNEFEKALLRCYSDKTGNDHQITLQKFTAPLKDGHIRILKLFGNANYAPQISWEWIENQLVITTVYDSTINVKVGDIITNINGQRSDEYFKEIYSRISAGTDGWLNFRAKTLSLIGDQDSKLIVSIDNKSIELIRNKLLKSDIEDPNNKEDYKKLDDSTYYINLNMIMMDTITKLIPQLEKSKAIICDLRAYPNKNDEFIRHLLKSDDTTKAWMQVPLIIFPDHLNTIGFEKYNWIDRMKPQKPHLGDKKIVFIISGRTISWGESIMGYIDGYKLGVIIGQPSAGTNGNINRFALAGGYTIFFTGMKVVKHNGSQHHGIGIIPDVYVEKTIKGIIEGRDEFLEKAIEIAKKK